MLWFCCVSAALALQPTQEPPQPSESSSDDTPAVESSPDEAPMTDSSPEEAPAAESSPDEAPANTTSDSKSDKASKSSDPLFLWSVRTGVSSMSLRASQSTEDSTTQFPSEASFPAVRGVGFSASGELWWKQKFALEGGVRYAGYRLNIASDTQRDGVGAWHLGLRYRHPLLRILSLDSLVGVQRTDVGVLQYTNEQTSAELIGQPLTGARVGVGAFLELGPVDVGTLVAETFGPGPVLTEWDLKLEYALTFIEVIDHHPSIYMGWTSVWRHWGRDLDGVKVKGRDAQGLFRIGAGFVF